MFVCSPLCVGVRGFCVSSQTFDWAGFLKPGTLGQAVAWSGTLEPLLGNKEATGECAGASEGFKNCPGACEGAEQ